MDVPGNPGVRALNLDDEGRIEDPGLPGTAKPRHPADINPYLSLMNLYFISIFVIFCTTSLSPSRSPDHS